MPWTFNPFSGTFDQKGSGGGGGSSYIDGEVQNFSALPTANPPAVDSAYLVREPEGTWLINRKPAGIYIRVATTGTRATDWTYAGILPDVFNDANFLLYDNADSSKNLAFQLSGIPTGTTRTVDAPAGNGRMLVEGQSIGGTTAAAGTFTTLTSSSGTITASTPVNVLQTWNQSGVNFVGLLVNCTDNASGSGALLLRCQNTGFDRFTVAKDGTAVASQGMNAAQFLNTSANGAFYWSNGPELVRDAQDTLGIRRGTNPQTANIYNTFTSSTNHERGFLKWSSNVFQIGTEKGSAGGTARELRLQTDGTDRLTIDTTGQVGIGIAPARPLHIQGSAAFVRVDRVSTFGPALLLTRMTTAPTVDSSWLFGPTTNIAGVANDDFAIIDFGTATTGTSGTQRLTISKSTGQLTVNGNLNLSTKDLVTDTTTGTKIGTGTTQKLGFFNATPAVQPAAVANATDAASTQDRLNDLLARLRTLGLIAT
jgi:hypothetical protein